jgi:hypothetical protein
LFVCVLLAAQRAVQLAAQRKEFSVRAKSYSVDRRAATKPDDTQATQLAAKMAEAARG